MKPRVQHPKIHERKERGVPYWYFRYWEDELLPDGSVKTTRKRRICGPTKGPEAITRKKAELIRDGFLLELNAAFSRCEAAITAKEPPKLEAVIFGNLAKLWKEDYVENPKVRLAEPTRIKYRDRLRNHIMPRWEKTTLAEFENTKAILDWLQHECTSWYMMIDLRNIMSGIFTRAQEWGVLPRSYSNPMQWVKVGRKWTVREDRILTDEETVDLFSRLSDPQLLICEICLDTGTRISEAVGLQLRHVDLKRGTIRIEQRHCRGDVDSPKTNSSRRTLALGALTERLAGWIEKKKIMKPFDWVFPQDEDSGNPMWDSGVRKALKLAAVAAGCDFPGFGMHSFRRANITLRQEEGGSAIEASKIAGHSSVSMTGEYTKVRIERQDELTRAVQRRREEARKKMEGKAKQEQEQSAKEEAA